MTAAPRRRGLAALVACALAVAGVVLGAAPASAANDVLDARTRLYVDPQSTTAQAARTLRGQARQDARLLSRVPSGSWFTGGTPDEVRRDVSRLVRRTGRQVPVLVAYNVPFRDCALYSAGGAASLDEYRAWIEGFAAGIGDRQAVVVLEPDGLGVIPWYTTLDGVQESCRPAELDPQTAVDERFAALNHAVDVLAALPRTVVYLDGTGSSWLPAGESADRLLKAGVQRADGFFLNVSNYERTENVVHYGTWVSGCIAYVTQVAPGDFASCGHQYWSGGPANDWNGVQLSNQGVWSDDAADPLLNTAGITSRYAMILGDVEPSTHFVVDTSRNGQGAWAAPAGVYTDAETWCNPPGRGLGVRPTTRTGNDLVDAYLWIKVPGESDGQCLRGTAGPEDPERGMVAPQAGGWFVEQARELIALADPPLTRR
ncbi:glycoside hydrolase family 6 protein [Cellulomonas sp.]|uniref:glycoside hydrolase family 6 protein n=1 Tax=Cellulomonas sp. TaxID=40001 RepID=UPI0028115311|nr:glycoside hydrolase family 6 protein [Cellulomonas sp.]